MNRFLILLSSVIFLFAVSCSKDDEPDPDPTAPAIDCTPYEGVTYTEEIEPLMSGSCALSNCHGGDNPSLPKFTTYEEVFAGRAAIKDRVVAKTMPPSGQPSLSQDNINILRCWVESGAPE